MNKITNVRLHTPTVYEYQKVCDILVSLGIRPPGYIKRRGINKPQLLLKRKKL